MARFVFRQKTGTSARPVSELAKSATQLGAQVLAQSDAMLLVDGSDEMFSALAAGSPDFVAAQEVRHIIPKPPRVRVKKKS